MGNDTFNNEESVAGSCTSPSQNIFCQSIHSHTTLLSPFFHNNIMKYPQLVSMPSDVSDWLEEQLEARGIDAVVYTRYILSLLHSHPIDVIHPEDDLHFFRLKKNCEIESLVDELCQKLKEIKSVSPTPLPPTLTNNDTRNPKVSPQELAEKYYAAFPPLRPQSPTGRTATLISLVPKWRQEPTSPLKKKAQRKHGGAGQVGGYEQKFHIKVDNDKMKSRTQNKQRFSYLTRTKNTPQPKNDTFTADWELNVIKNRKLNNMKPKPFENDSPSMNSLDQCVSDAWTNDDDDDLNMYEDLPVDIRLLLDSPDPCDEENVEMMNIANMRDDGKRAYIPYGTNIMSSIWSNDRDVILYDNAFNTAMDAENSLDLKFGSIDINNRSSGWPSFQEKVISDNENDFFDKKSRVLDGFRSLPGDWKRSEVENAENEGVLKHLAISLMKLNHNKEKSSFTEIIPRSHSNRPFNPFDKTGMFNFNSRHSLSFDKEDLLTSEKSHFRPIIEKTDQRVHGQYADGATFVISNNLDKVDYKRSESGSMWLETDYGQSKKYLEYKTDESDSSPDLEFVLKFSISQNDKACQTEKSDISNNKPDAKVVRSPKLSWPPNNNSPVHQQCICRNVALTKNRSSCPIHIYPRPDSVTGEFLWKSEMKMCEKCNNNNVQWNIDWSAPFDSEWDSNNLRNIWNGGEICHACLNVQSGNAEPITPNSLQNMQLREDISQDGEQLLSDLTNLQKRYMEDGPVVAAELSCDLNEIVNKERKRRHSFIIDEQSSWSFASRLEEDCLIQMSTLPTLRSVTL